MAQFLASSDCAPASKTYKPSGSLDRSVLVVCKMAVIRVKTSAKKCRAFCAIYAECLCYSVIDQSTFALVEQKQIANGSVKFL